MTTMTLPEVEQTISQRVTELANHLTRAGKAHKAAILFATYLSEFTRVTAENQLEQMLKANGETIVHVHVKSEGKTVDLPQFLRHHPLSGEAVFFIYDLKQGGSTVEKHLNYRREFLIEDHQRILCWLHESDLGVLARHAPDFWAFRGRTISFLDQPTIASQEELLSALPFFAYNPGQQSLPSELENSIRLRQELLQGLPRNKNTEASRTELLYTLALYSNLARQPEKSLNYLDEAAELAKTAVPHLLPHIYNTKGNILHQLNQYTAALEVYEQSLQLAPDEAGIHSNRGNVLNDLGRYDEAIAAFDKALELQPNFANAFNGKGNTYLHLGRYEEALAAFNNAIEYNPDSAYIYNNQGNALRDMDRQSEAMAAFNKATQLDPNYAIPWLNKALLAMQQQQPQEAMQNLAIGLQKAPQYRHWVANRPAFISLRATPEFNTLLLPNRQENHPEA